MSRNSRLLVVIFMFLHGMVHLLGAIEVWGIADLEELSGRLSFDVGLPASLLAATWPVATALLLAAGYGMFSNQSWWRSAALFGVIVSQFAIILWWDDAAIGTIPNLIIVILAIVAPILGSGATANAGTRAIT